MVEREELNTLGPNRSLGEGQEPGGARCRAGGPRKSGADKPELLRRKDKRP